MTVAELPQIQRFNAWGDWHPLVTPLSMEEVRRVQTEAARLRSRELSAVFQHSLLTQHPCVEFVMVAGFVDSAPFREYPHNLLVVPCDDVRAAEQEATRSHDRVDYLYDGHAPLQQVTAHSIRDTLLRIDEAVTLIGHAHRVPVRWFPKYIELTDHLPSYRHIDEGDWMYHAEVVGRFASLPDPIRPSLARAVHWCMRASLQRNPIDSILQYWFAIETLLLALYDHGEAIGLPLICARITAGARSACS
jgi:hypothetical protein